MGGTEGEWFGVRLNEESDNSFFLQIPEPIIISGIVTYDGTPLTAMVLAPYKTTLTAGTYNLEIAMLKDEGGKQLVVTIGSISESPTKPGWYDISGTIENETGTALVAMALEAFSQQVQDKILSIIIR